LQVPRDAVTYRHVELPGHDMAMRQAEARIAS
jgi:hypothetical protein